MDRTVGDNEMMEAHDSTRTLIALAIAVPFDGAADYDYLSADRVLETLDEHGLRIVNREEDDRVRAEVDSLRSVLGEIATHPEAIKVAYEQGYSAGRDEEARRHSEPSSVVSDAGPDPVGYPLPPADPPTAEQAAYARSWGWDV